MQIWTKTLDLNLNYRKWKINMKNRKDYDLLKSVAKNSNFNGI